MKLAFVNVSAMYERSADSCQEQGDTQYLEVEVLDAGGGPYVVLKTDRFALDLDDVKKLYGLFKGLIERSKTDG